MRGRAPLLLCVLLLALTACESKRVAVEITSDPTGSVVYVNNRLEGQTPLTIQVEPDTANPYLVVPDEPYADYRLYKPYSGMLKVTEGTSISVWIERTTAEEQAAQRAAAEEQRQQEAEAAAQREREAEARRQAARERRERELEASRVYYRLETNCRQGADLTFTNNNGDITQQSRQGNGWYYGFVPRDGQYLSISAQNNCDRGYVTVKFVKAGVTIRENTSSGGYVIASISGVW